MNNAYINLKLKLTYYKIESYALKMFFLIPHLQNFPLHWAEIITENHSNQSTELWRRVSIDTFIKQFLTLSSGNSVKEETEGL